MSSQHIKIDSSQRVNPLTTSPSQFSIRGSNTVFCGRYHLKAVFMPVTFYNVSATNNQIYFTDSNGSHTISLQPGFYTSSLYLPAIATAMTAAGAGITYTLALDPITQHVTVSSSSGTFTLNFSNTLNSAASTLGFSFVDTLTASSQLSVGILNLAQTKTFNISINSATSTNDLNSRGYSFVVPCTSNTPSIEYYETQPGYMQSIQIDSPVRQLDITVYDDNHVILPLFSDWYMILQTTQVYD